MNHEKKKRRSRRTAAGILLTAAMALCAACGAEKTGRAALNTAAPGDTVEMMWTESAAKREAAVREAGEREAAIQEAAARNAEAQENEPEGSFTVTYQGQKAVNDIELRHCECVYDEADIQIYAKYLYWLSVPETFPYDQYVLYIRTPQEELQLYPVKDFLVDEEHGILYTKIAGDDGFERIRSMSFTEKSGSMPDSGREILNAEQAEELLCCAYDEKKGSGQDGSRALFTNITVELTEVCGDGAGVLKGEVGGFEKATGQRYYADWEIDMNDGIMTSELCVLKQYDPVKDKETFADCDRVFDRIEQGDWSAVKPVEEQYLWEMDAEEWLRMDVNGDGMPELVGGWVIEELPDYADSRKIEISVIFAYQDGMAEMVYVDVNDGMEFLFVTAYGELVYEWGVSGGPMTSVFRRCTFDLKWNREYLDTLVRYRFPEALEEDELFAGEREYYREHYPDTYGTGGSGTYFLRERRKTEEELKHNDDGKYIVREYLTEEAFLQIYEEWTGWDFYKAQYMY